MKIAIIVQARMEGKRLPGKVLLKAGPLTMLEHLITRLRLVDKVDEIVIATTNRPDDKTISRFVKSLDIDIFRGSSSDVLERFYYTAKSISADVIIRICADCPLIDPAVVTRVLDSYLEHYPDYDYVSNTCERTFPRGMDTEVFSFAALEKAFKEATAQKEREHVTPYFYQNNGLFRIHQVKNDRDLSSHRWTLDTPEDLEFIQTVIEHLVEGAEGYSIDAVLQVLSEHPEWSKINSHIKQKPWQ